MKTCYWVLGILLAFGIGLCVGIDFLIVEKTPRLEFSLSNWVSAIANIVMAIFAMIASYISYTHWKNDKYISYIQDLNNVHENIFKPINKEFLVHLQHSQDKVMGKEPYAIILDEVRKLNFSGYVNLLYEYQQFNHQHPYHLTLIKLLERLESTYNRLGLYLLLYIEKDGNGIWTTGEAIYKQKADKSIKRLLKLERDFSRTRKKMLSYLYQQIHKV